ncbi:MAG: response regulator transcription factor [Thermoflexales bacterium]|nr:response regulator transcription factor [Thermoflexales bacterium]
MGTRILLVDDNPNVLSFVRPALEREGYQVVTAGDGAEALYQAEEFDPGLIVLDIELPEPNGLEVCRQLRRRGDQTPIIFLTVRDSVTDLEVGFEFGANDYITKPFDVRELLARVKARLPPSSLEIDKVLRIDASRRKVWVRRDDAWQEASLTPKEFDLLQYLVYNAGRPIGKATLLEQVFDFPDDVETKTVEKHIWALRQKLEANPAEPCYILNVRGIGYKFEG